MYNTICINIKCNLNLWNSTKFSIIDTYSPTTGKAISLSPVTTMNAIDDGSNTIAFCQFAEKNGKYLAVASTAVLASELDTSDEMSFTINNIRLEDLFPYINDSEANPLNGILFPNPSSVPFAYRQMLRNDINRIIATLLLDKDTWEYDGQRLFRTDLETLSVKCVIPFFQLEKMIVRETSEYYEIIIGSPYMNFVWTYMIKCLPSFRGIHYNDMVAGFSSIYKSELMDNSSIYPILRIDKDSEEPVGATFIWDFPAQLTTDEEIKAVVRSRFFRDNNKMKFSLV